MVQLSTQVRRGSVWPLRMPVTHLMKDSCDSSELSPRRRDEPSDRTDDETGEELPLPLPL